MADLKTQKTAQRVEDFIMGIESEQSRKDCMVLVEMMQQITGCQAAMWGSSIIGFGQYHYVYDSGREGDWFITGFSPRKQNISLYIMDGFSRYKALLEKLGKHKTGSSCLYVKQLSDISIEVLHQLISASVHYMKNK